MAKGALKTEVGQALEPALFALAHWGEQHFMPPPCKADAKRPRYFMTSMRRKLRPTSRTTRLQLYIDDAAFAVRLGPEPSVVQGEHEADVTIRGRFASLAKLSIERVPLRELLAKRAVAVEGELERVNDLLCAWP